MLSIKPFWKWPEMPRTAKSSGKSHCESLRAFF